MATLGFGGILCAGAVLAAGFIGAQLGSAAGDELTSNSTIGGAIHAAEDSIGDAVDWITFWDND